MHNKIRNFIFGDSPLVLRFMVFSIMVVSRTIALPLILVSIAILNLFKEMPNDLKSFLNDVKYGYNKVMKNGK